MIPPLDYANYPALKTLYPSPLGPFASFGMSHFSLEIVSLFFLCVCSVVESCPTLGNIFFPSLLLINFLAMGKTSDSSLHPYQELRPIEGGSPGSPSTNRNVDVVQLLNHVRLFVAPWTAACQASLSFTTSLSLCKLMSIESMMPSNHLILCHPLLLLPSVFPNIRVFSRWPKYWSFSFSISLSNEYSGLI